MQSDLVALTEEFGASEVLIELICSGLLFFRETWEPDLMRHWVVVLLTLDPNHSQEKLSKLVVKIAQLI